MATLTPEVYTSMGLNDGEYELILELMGREPTLTELGMFAVMWSEHCGYKYSRPVLAYFSRYKEALEGKGFENAGVVDIGDGLGVTMKVESHNHPSAVEPYQGAATGVGGIIRDILTMGARPIALLNSLRFGPIGGTAFQAKSPKHDVVTNESEPELEASPTHGLEANAAVIERNRYLFEHVVAGIAGYGNCVGVPTVGGEVDFDPRYSGNPLVNAMCVGILRMDELTTAEAKGVGNPVLYLGSATGKDGIHGATFASAELDEASESKRPNVQIGDPFAEKQLIEATLEALQTGAIVAIQDMGAAGLTCSTIEMSSKGEVGMEIDLDLVPMREDDMTGYELMLSESQERMLAVAEKGREQEVISVFHKWGLQAAVIGHVTDDGWTTILRHGEVEAKVQATWLADNCPTYHPPAIEPDYYAAAKNFDYDSVPVADVEEALLKLLNSPTIASKRWVFRQYDQQVQTQTALIAGDGDAAVIAPRGTRKGLAVKIDGNARFTFLDPYVGGQLAVAEAARNVACTGGKPVAVTDGLNFGSPQDPHVFWQFQNAVKGIADAADAMGTPVISGNVSFYNESELGEVLPTPLIGMLGVLSDAAKRLGIAPKAEGGELLLIHANSANSSNLGLGGSMYLQEVHGVFNGLPAAPDLASERKLCDLLVEATEKGWISSAHDTSEGGIAVALAEIAMAKRCSISVDFGNLEGRPDGLLFGEVPGRVIVTVDSETNRAQLEEAAQERGLRIYRFGRFSPGYSLEISLGGQKFRWDGENLWHNYGEAIERQLRQ